MPIPSNPLLLINLGFSQKSRAMSIPPPASRVRAYLPSAIAEASAWPVI